MQKVAFYSLLLLSILTVSCLDSNDDPKPQIEVVEDFQEGVFIINEGGYEKSEGSLSFFNPQTINVTNEAYALVNADEIVGDVLQSVHATGDELYLIVNNDNKVIVTDDSLRLKRTMTNFSLPRNMVSYEGKGYITETVSYAEQGRVAVLDLERGFLSKTIAMDWYPESLLIAGDHLYVSNQGSDNLFVVSLISDEVVDTVAVGASPGRMVLDDDGDIWVACGGGYGADYAPLNNGSLYEVDPQTNEVIATVDLGMNTDAKIAIDNQGERVYFYSGTDVYYVSTSSPETPSAPFFTASNALGLYGIGFSPDDLIYLADARDYVEPGEVFIYNEAGVIVSNFTVGQVPNGFLFN
ncbi:MAG: DUF5074 domain-containing protein [Cyclobacteriaceae bacterium]